MSNVAPLPAAFLIGAATSAHQTEGNNLSSDWWEFENRAGSPLAERSGDACDSLNRWREDLDLAADAGLQAYRFSLEWARIEPVQGRFSRSAIDHYARMIAGAIERGLEPIVTLHHFTNPLWFTEGGGWLRDDAVDLFVAYVTRVLPLLTLGVSKVVTINEPNMVAIMHRVIAGEASLSHGLGGGLPEPHQGVTEQLIAAHEAARDLIRAHHPGLLIGWSVANQVVQWTPEGRQRGLEYRELVEDQFLRAAHDDDFIGVQAYTRTVFTDTGVVRDESAPQTLTGWEVYPQALELAVRHTAEVLPGVALLVTENGIATSDDDQRIHYLASALQGLMHCIADGLPVLGYLHWSLLDNYEWGSWKPTFGLIGVDRDTFARMPRPSLGYLGAIARSRQIVDVSPQA